MQETRFKKGNQVAVGNRGGGRPLDWLKERCRELVKEHKIIEFVAQVASGEYVTNVVSGTGEKLEMKVSADVDDRLKAANMLLDRGFGKPKEHVELSAQVNIVEAVLLAREERGLN